MAEAIARSHEDAGVDVQRIGGRLTTVTMRLCADDARDRARDPKRVAYQLRQGTAAEDHSQDVCDRGEATWLASHLTGLPERQRRALQLRADGADVSAIAQAMCVSYRVADGLLQRARAHMRAVLATAASWIGLLLGALVAVTRRRTGVTTGTLTLAAASATVVIGGLSLPSAGPAEQVLTPTAELSVSSNDDAVPLAPTATTQPAALAPQGVEPAQIPVPKPGVDAVSPPQSATEIPKIPPPTLAPRKAEVSDVAVSGGSTSHRQSDESLLESTQKCLESGPEISMNAVGCDPD